MKIFGIPIVLDFSTDTVDKQDRYNELKAITDDESVPLDQELYGEQIQLFHELVQRGAISTEYEPVEPAPETQGFWSKLFS